MGLQVLTIAKVGVTVCRRGRDCCYQGSLRLSPCPHVPRFSFALNASDILDANFGPPLPPPSPPPPPPPARAAHNLGTHRRPLGWWCNSKATWCKWCCDQTKPTNCKSDQAEEWHHSQNLWWIRVRFFLRLGGFLFCFNHALLLLRSNCKSSLISFCRE